MTKIKPVRSLLLVRGNYQVNSRLKQKEENEKKREV
jgi:hypothetical protein